MFENQLWCKVIVVRTFSVQPTPTVLLWSRNTHQEIVTFVESFRTSTVPSPRRMNSQWSIQTWCEVSTRTPSLSLSSLFPSQSPGT